MCSSDLKSMMEQTKVGNPLDEGQHIGPVVNKAQFEKIQGLIQSAIDEGATLVTGGPGRPDGIETGYYARPTVFAGVNNDMKIARNEIFGPVLVTIPFQTLDEAIAIANDTPYGLAAYVQTGDHQKALYVAKRLRAGSVYLNGVGQDYSSPFGGFKQSGNGREWGKYGLLDFTEFKVINGFHEA